MTEFTKFTHSIKSDGTEMLVIRTDDENELRELRNRFYESIAGPAPKEEEPKPKEPIKESTQAAAPQKTNGKPYLHDGDGCHLCNGTMTLKTGRKGTQSFQFLGCSNYPDCTFTAYVSKFPKKESA